jgi:hypothetical protein
MSFPTTTRNGYSVDRSTALEASSISKATKGKLYRFAGKIDTTAATDIYYIQLLNASSLPGDGAVTTLVAPLEVNHTNGTSTLFDFDLGPRGVQASSGIVIVASTTEFTKTIAGNVMSATVLFD